MSESVRNETSRSSTAPPPAGSGSLRAHLGGRGLAVEQLEQPRARRDRALRHPQRDAEHPHRPGQHQHVRVERGELAGGQRPVDHLAPADDEHRRQAELRQERDQRVVERPQPRADEVLVEDALDRRAEAAELPLLAREGLHHAHAGDVLLDVRGQLGDPLLDLLQRGPRAHPVAPGDQHDERGGSEGEQAQPGLQQDHGHGRQHDRQQRLRDEHEPVAEEEAHGLQVDRRPRHQLAGLLSVEEAHLQTEQVAVEALAHVDLDREGHAAGDEPPQHAENQPADGRQDDRQHEDPQAAAVVAVDLVDGPAGQRGERCRPHHRERGEHEGADRSTAIRAEKSQ